MKELSRQVELMDLESANIRVAEHRAAMQQAALWGRQFMRAISCAACGHGKFVLEK